MTNITAPCGARTATNYGSENNYYNLPHYLFLDNLFCIGRIMHISFANEVALTVLLMAHIVQNKRDKEEELSISHDR
jgi:hypothetical protein